jgi:hypothetical protein
MNKFVSPSIEIVSAERISPRIAHVSRRTADHRSFSENLDPGTHGAIGTRRTGAGQFGQD